MNIESSNGKNSRSTVGVSANIIEASWQALRDSLNYKLLQTRDKVLMRQLWGVFKLKIIFDSLNIIYPISFSLIIPR